MYLWHMLVEAVLDPAVWSVDGCPATGVRSQVQKLENVFFENVTVTCAHSVTDTTMYESVSKGYPISPSRIVPTIMLHRPEASHAVNWRSFLREARGQLQDILMSSFLRCEASDCENRSIAFH